MAWLTPVEIKARFNFSLKDETDDSPIEFASRLAAYKLSDWLKDADYQLAEDAAVPTDAGELNRFNRIIDAHALLTVSRVFLTNTQIRTGGVVQNEADGDEPTIHYYKPKELAELRAQYLEEATSLLASFAKVNLSGDETISEMEVVSSHPSLLLTRCSLN